VAHIKAVELVPRVRKNKGPKRPAPKVPAGKAVRMGFGRYRIVK
jgi:hypothetical protein